MTADGKIPEPEHFRMQILQVAGQPLEPDTRPDRAPRAGVQEPGERMNEVAYRIHEEPTSLREVMTMRESSPVPARPEKAESQSVPVVDVDHTEPVQPRESSTRLRPDSGRRSRMTVHEASVSLGEPRRVPALGVEYDEVESGEGAV